MSLKSLLSLILFFLLLAGGFLFSGYVLYQNISEIPEKEFSGRYQKMITMIVSQIQLSRNSEDFMVLRNMLDELRRSDDNIISIVFLKENKEPVIKLGSTSVDVQTRLFVREIKKNGETRGICQLTVSLANLNISRERIRARLLFFFTLLYAITMVMVLLYYGVYALIPEKNLRLALLADSSVEKKSLEELNLPHPWERLKGTLLSIFQKMFIQMGKRELAHPVTGQDSYLLCHNILNRDITEGKDYEYFIVSMLGFNILCESYGFREAYDFLEELVSELSAALTKVTDDIYIGHLTDTTLIIRTCPGKTKDIAEKLLVIFKNRVKDYSSEHISLKKGWSRMIVFVLTNDDLEEGDLEYLEKLYFKGLSKMSKKNRGNVAFRYNKKGDLIKVTEV